MQLKGGVCVHVCVACVRVVRVRVPISLRDVFRHGSTATSTGVTSMES
jgi:hypothetical protein